MEESKPARLHQQEQAVEEAYRRRYHHGISRSRELLLRLLAEGMPAAAAMDSVASLSSRSFYPGVCMQPVRVLLLLSSTLRNASGCFETIRSVKAGANRERHD